MEVARRAQASAHGRRLFVSGVASEVKKTDLQKEFGEFGHVTDIELPLTAKGVAFVEFDNARDAADALEEVTGRKLKGMVLKVKMADIQKTSTGPAAAALAQDRMSGMTRVENDARPLRSRGPAATVVPTANQEREDRRAPARPRERREEPCSRRRGRSGGRGERRSRSRSASRARRSSRARAGSGNSPRRGGSRRRRSSSSRAQSQEKGRRSRSRSSRSKAHKNGRPASPRKARSASSGSGKAEARSDSPGSSSGR